MKKIALFLGLSFFLFYCKTKKETTKTAPVSTSVNKMSALDIAQKRWPGATTEELAEGKTIYTTKCNTCHGLKRIETRSEKSWLHEIDDMSPKAHLTAQEKEKLTRYILSYRESVTSTD